MNRRTFRALGSRCPARRLVRSLSKDRAEFSTHRRLTGRMQCSRMKLLRHELRTPLTGILGMSELLQKSGLAGEQRDLLKALQDSGRQMETLLRRMARPPPATGVGGAVRPGTVNGLQLLERAVRAHWPAALKKDIGLYLVFDHRLPEYWHSDAVCLRQLLDNLLANAVKFTHRGHVLLYARRAGRERHGRFDVELQVRDTGIGVVDGASRRIYSIREQGNANVSRCYGGSGLGLFVCERITAALGGSVWHQTDSVGGSCFTARLPGIAKSAHGTMHRLRPALLTGLRCQLGLSNPLNRVLTLWLRRMDIQASRIGRHKLQRVPDGCDLVICDPDRVAASVHGVQTGAGHGRPVLLLSRDFLPAANGSGSEHKVRVLELPQPILHSNLEPLMLRLALQRAMYEIQDSVLIRSRSVPAGDPDRHRE